MRIISDCTFSDFTNSVKLRDSQIICYGAGLVAISIEDIFDKAGILNHVCCFIDADPRKQGTSITISGNTVVVKSFEDLRMMRLSDKVLLITIEAFGSVIESLNGYLELDKLDCYIFPALNRSCVTAAISNDDFCKFGYKQRPDRERIPRTLHYCWFGNGEMPETMKEYIAGWARHNPDYKITRWNEDNYDVYQNNYIKQAYQAGKFAFVSDFARLDMLYKYGGIYLDTDVMVLKSLDDLLYNEAFIAYNEWAVPNSAICGSIPNHELIRKMRDHPRSQMNFIRDDGTLNQTVNSAYESEVLSQFGFIKDFTFQKIKNMSVYPPCFFPQVGRLGINAEIDDRTYAVHYAFGSWADQKRVKELEQTESFINCIK